MEHRQPISALEVATGHLESWVLSCVGFVPKFRMTCEALDERRWTSEAFDVFECLMRLRHQVEQAGWLLCCNGARRDSWASGMQREMGGGSHVYLLEGVPRGKKAPMARTLEPVSPELAATIKQQFLWHGEWLTERGEPEQSSDGEKLYAEWLGRIPKTVTQITSSTEDYVRNRMRQSLRHHFQPIALRIIAEGGGSAQTAQIRQAMEARHPHMKGGWWHHSLEALEDNHIVQVTDTTVGFVENLKSGQIASLLSALDECAVRTEGLRGEDASWRPDAAKWQALRQKVIERDGERCNVPGCDRAEELQLDRVWRGSLLAAIGWAPSDINNPINLQLLCPVHHVYKAAQEAELVSADDAMLRLDQ